MVVKQPIRSLCRLFHFNTYSWHCRNSTYNIFYVTHEGLNKRFPTVSQVPDILVVKFLQSFPAPTTSCAISGILFQLRNQRRFRLLLLHGQYAPNLRNSLLCRIQKADQS